MCPPNSGHHGESTQYKTIQTKYVFKTSFDGRSGLFQTTLISHCLTSLLLKLTLILAKSLTSDPYNRGPLFWRKSVPWYAYPVFNDSESPLAASFMGPESGDVGNRSELREDFWKGIWSNILLQGPHINPWLDRQNHPFQQLDFINFASPEIVTIMIKMLGSRITVLLLKCTIIIQQSRIGDFFQVTASGFGRWRRLIKIQGWQLGADKINFCPFPPSWFLC